jgi:cell division inhibitor SepF
MPGAMRKMAVYLGLVEDDSYGGPDEYDDFEEPARQSRRERRGNRRGFKDRYEDEEEDDRYAVRSVRPISEPRAVRTFRADSPVDRLPTSAPMYGRGVPVSDLSRIETIHPRSYNDARRIGEEFRAGVPVIMNLGDMDEMDAKRIIDFAAGLVFGLHGTIERVTGKVFLISPANVDLGDQARAQIAEDGFFNQS